MASGICRSLYPYLSDRIWNRYKTAPTDLESFNGFQKIELEEKLANFSLSENTFNEEIPSQSNASDELRLVIIGKTGQGKSATANTILGKADSFAEDNTSTSVTRESRRITELVDGRKISVMDTPGLQDTHLSNKRILKELAKITTLFPDGVHAFVYVMNMADPRFTAEDKHVLDLIEKTFGGYFKNYCLLVFSHGDSALKDTDLDTYRKKQMESSGYPTAQYSRQDSRGKEQEQEQNSLAKFIDELDWKMLAIDNKTSIPFEKEHNRNQIVAIVDRMRTLNSPEIYTNDMFVEAQQQRKAMKQKGLKKGWDPSIMSKVETILAANPDISREELQAEVRRQLQVEQEERVEKEQREMQERREREQRRERELEEQDNERRRLVAEEQEERAKQFHLQKDEWEKHQKKEKEEFEMLQKHKEEMWERQFREDQQRRQKQEEEILRRRKEEESRRMIQKEQEEAEIQDRFRREQIELENMLSKIKKEELERQMKRKEEEQERKEWQEEERKQFELRQRQAREERLRENEEFERRRQEQLEKEELERQKKRKREDKERERKTEREQEEREKAERERRQREHTERLQREREEQVNEIADEHMRMWEKAINGAVAIAKTVVGWFF